MKRVLLLAMLIGCGGATTAPAKSRPQPTETDACERICATYDDCHISPPNCAAGCAEDQKKLRDGIQPSFAVCLERELYQCDLRTVPERRQIVSLCFSAVVEAYAKDDTALVTIVRAVCAHESKCATDPNPQCENEVATAMKRSPQSKALAIGRPELVTKIAACVSAAGCTDPDPISNCLSAP